MLAPMQGLTNPALRSLFIDWVQPDVVFTEFMRVHQETRKKCLKPGNLKEITDADTSVPLITQLIGSEEHSLVLAAQLVQEAGAHHINLNMGCPYGRMGSKSAGGGILKNPENLPSILPALRRIIKGSFSIKLRAGYDDPKQIFDLLPLFEDCGIDYLIVHPRTVTQKYAGQADHEITERVVAQSTLPVIANGDIFTAATGKKVLEETGTAGLMLARGAISDPLLFKRLRLENPGEPDLKQTGAMIHYYLSHLLPGYTTLFCGEQQVLAKMKEVVSLMNHTDYKQTCKKLKRATSLAAFSTVLAELQTDEYAPKS